MTAKAERQGTQPAGAKHAPGPNALPAAATSPEPERHLLAREVMALLRVGTRTLWNWDRDGILKSVSPTRRRLYQLSDVEWCIRNRRS